ncbi:MAG: tRNA pseudouridine(55) synthase TruB [Chitinophagales bacterium]
MSPSTFSNTVLLFDKPIRWTSFDVVNKVHYLIRQKTGHAGTLDPLATGLLILCTGTETKNITSFQSLDKEYTGTMIMGSATPSFDLETAIDQEYDISHITEEMILSAAEKFIGTMEQTPPSHSAKHSEGKRYYKLARAGKSFDLKKQVVTLNEFEITKVSLPEVDFRIVCGKGYYVRSLINDLGRSLHAGAHVSALCRIRIGHYHLKDAWKMGEFAKFVKAERDSAVTGISGESPNA